MAIIIETSQPEEFLALLKRKMDRGDVKSWCYDEDGDFTLSNRELANKAWLHPYVKEDSLILGILGRKNTMLSIYEYSLYHSAMIEVLILFFNKVVEKIVVTQPMLSNYDTHSIDYGKYEY